MKTRLSTILTLLCVLLGCSSAFAQSENPFLGAWDIDKDESRFGSANPPQNMSRMYTDLGNGSFAYQVVTVNQEGVLGLSSAIYSYNGEQYPIIAFDQFAEPARISYRKINDTTVEYTVRLGGEITQIGAKFISPNYQRLTISIQFPNSDLENQVLVFNRRK